jgi:5-methylcytosine-specific restriction endonuclease McrA
MTADKDGNNTLEEQEQDVPEQPPEAVEAELQESVPEKLDVHIGKTWKEEDWRKLIEKLVSEGLVNWQGVAAVTLGELNPPQVGTSLASNANIKKRYPPKKAWQAVKSWFYDQPLGCRECKTLLKLEAEHIVPKEELGDAADNLDNLQLLCKRCNAKKRPSHKNAGLTHLTAESGLMWILLQFHPKTYDVFKKLCRDYGMTMADIRFQEAWALAEWLKKANRY